MQIDMEFAHLYSNQVASIYILRASLVGDFSLSLGSDFSDKKQLTNIFCVD